MEKAFQVAGMD